MSDSIVAAATSATGPFPPGASMNPQPVAPAGPCVARVCWLRLRACRMAQLAGVALSSAEQQGRRRQRSFLRDPAIFQSHYFPFPTSCILPVSRSLHFPSSRFLHLSSFSPSLFSGSPNAPTQRTFAGTVGRVSANVCPRPLLPLKRRLARASAAILPGTTVVLYLPLFLFSIATTGMHL
jgi:hypothetical protein